MLMCIKNKNFWFRFDTVIEEYAPVFDNFSNAQNCMNVLGCKIEKVDDFRLEEDEAERLLIRIKKCKGTPKLYPRKAGTPSKNPL